MAKAPEDRGASEGAAVDPVVMHDKAPENRGAAKGATIDEVVMHDKTPEDRGATSPILQRSGNPRDAETPVADFVLLYFTLVDDGAVPPDYLAEFITLETYVRTPAARSDRSHEGITNVPTAVWLHQRQRSQVR